MGALVGNGGPAGREPVEWVFVNLETGTADGLDESAYFVELSRLSDDEEDTLNDADAFGAYNEEQCSVVRRVGVPVSELVKAWGMVQRLRSSVQRAALLPDRDYHFTVVARRGDQGVSLWSDTVAIFDETRTVFDHSSGEWVAVGSADDEAGDWDIHLALRELAGVLGAAVGSDADQDYDNRHRCDGCGVTGGGVVNGACQDCDRVTGVEA